MSERVYCLITERICVCVCQKTQTDCSPGRQVSYGHILEVLLPDWNLDQNLAETISIYQELSPTLGKSARGSFSVLICSTRMYSRCHFAKMV